MGLSNCITKARDAIKKSAKKQRNQAMRSGAPDTSEQFAETQEKALVGLIARIGDVQALDGDNQAAADAIRSAIEDLMLDREALSIQVERAGLEMPAAPDVAVAEKADQPSAETVTAPAEAEASNSAAMRGNHRDPAKVNIFNPYEDGDIVSIGGQDWQVKNDGGWYLTNTGNWRGEHPTIKKVAAMTDLISMVEKAAVDSSDAATEAEQDKAPADTRLTSAQASDQMEWRNLGQRDGTKTQALFFYETAEDMAAHRGSMQYGEVTQYDGGKWQFDGVSYDSLGAAKKAAEQAAVVRLVKDGYVENPFAKYDAEAKSYGYEVKPDGLIHLNGEPTGVAISEKSGRLRVQSSSGTLLGTYPADADALGRFLKSFWYAEKKGVPEPAPASDPRDSFTVERLNRETDQMQTTQFNRGQYVKALVSGSGQDANWSFGEIEGISQVKREAKVDGLWYSFGSIYEAERPAVAAPETVPMSEVIDSVNAANSEGITEADRIATVESHSEFTDRLNDGNVTIDEFKARFESVKKSKDALIAELGKKTKPELLAILGGYRADRMKNDKKDRIVDSVYTSMLDDFVLGDSISYSFGSKYEDVIGGYVARYGQADIDAYAERIKASRAEREQRAEKIAAAVKDPQDFAEYQVYIKAKMAEGMTLQQARMSLPAEKRAMFDNEMAEASRNARGERKEVAKTQVQAAAQTTAGQLFETKHTKTGEPLFVVKTADRADREIYNQWNATAKRLGGYYSSYRGNGAIPGFTFKTKDGAEAFMQYLGGDTVAAQEAIKTDRDAFADDRSQSAVERLNEMADRLDANADSVLSADRKTNTERRARFAASAEAAANSNKAMAQTMRNIAKSISEGTAKFLDMVRQKAQVEMLRSKLQTAKQDEAKAQDPNGWYTKELHKKPATVETADFATWPTYTAYRSDLAQMGRALLQLDGGKRLGQSVLKVADDVTNAYKAFAKENLYKVSTFKTSDGGPAVFSTADKAEEAIARSGFKGKATTISFKRGEHLVIMGPQMARENGIWQGDDDQRITLAPDFAEQIVAFNKSLNKRTQDIRMPWVFDNVAQERARWKAMGIETPAEMRAALREFVSLNEQAKEVDKIKQMERAMIGRRNDGLDFFPTSQDVVQQMLESAEIEPGMSVLEPSAGMGHIADQIRAAGVDPDVIELSGDRRELLEAKGFNVIGSDFTELNPRVFTFGDVFKAPDGTVGVMRGSGGLGSNRVGLQPLDAEGNPDARRSMWVDRDSLVGVEKRGAMSGYDRIIMNPPFSNRRDAEHVQRAYTMLRPGGRIVAIMGDGVFFGQDKKAVEFREWLESVGGTSEKLPEGSFLDPSLPVNTAVNARMVVIDKPDTATEKTDGGIALLSPSLGRVDADKVDVATASAVVSGLLAGWRNAPNSSVVATASDLPVVVREELANQGEKTARGVYHGGTFYLVADEHSTEAEIEETVFHEVWSHYGLRSMFGAQTTTKLAAVFDAISASGFMGLPGKDAFRAFSRQHGFETAQTEAMLRKGETFDPRFTEAVKKRILVEELIAKVQEKGAPDTLKRKALELIGAIREWLRSVGFGHLMKYSDADLMRLVQRARDTVVYGKPGSAGKGNSPAVLMRIPRSPSAAETITFDPANPDIRYNRVFFSQLSNAFEQAPDRIFGPAAQVKAWLASNAAKLQVKKDEIEWTGLNDWLDLQGKQKVTKQQVLDYLQQNGVQVEEVMKGEDSLVKKDGESLRDFAMRNGMQESDAEQVSTLASSGNETAERIVSAYRYPMRHMEGTAGTKYSQYVLPGGENYRELLLTLPAADISARIEELREQYIRARSDDAERIAGELKALKAKRDSSQYKSSHWDEKNIIAHVRFNDRTDADGAKTLFIEEMQSDAGQDKRKGKTDWKAPFIDKTEGWLDLALKRMIAYAVEHGYDKIAFVNGEQSAERYDLSKQVDQISIGSYSGGGFQVVARKDGEVVLDRVAADEKELESLVGKDIAKKHIETKQMTFKGLDLKVGGEGMKTFYDQIVPQRVREVLKKLGGGKVEDVRLGMTFEEYAEKNGYRADGDKLFNKYGQEMNARTVRRNYDDLYNGAPTNQPGFTITPEMREMVAKGLPLFNKPEESGQTSATDQAIYAMAEEGRSVGEILDYIAASSSSPFNRALAGLLKTAGVKTKITVGGSSGWTLNSGDGGKFSAGYNPASDTAALFRSQAAERNILHELVHASTLAALERNGLASSKMKALFAHVKRSGKLDGTYGMTSIDEFAAEVFTNPKFQELLKTIEAAPINGKKARSAWDWFVGIVRGILGMEAGQDNALSQALEIGVAVMEENTAMRDGEVAFTEITGKEIDAMPGDTLQSKATNWLRQNLQGKTVVNESTGWEISTGRKGINKAMSHSGTESVARSVAAIPDLLKNAVLVQTEQNNNTSERDDVPLVHHFYAPVRIGGSDYVARVVVKEAKDGTRFYDYDTSNEISPADPDSTLPFSQRRGAEPGERPAMSMSELLSYVKEEHGGKDSRFTRHADVGKVRGMADEDTVSGTSIRRGTAEEAQANGFTMRAYRGVSAASPFNDSGTVWLTTSRSAAESYATEVFGYEDPEVIEVWVKPDQIPVWDMRKVSDEELETLNPDEFGNPQNIGIYRNSDDSMLGGSGAGTVIHAPVESIFVIDDEAAGRIRYNVASKEISSVSHAIKVADRISDLAEASGIQVSREGALTGSQYLRLFADDGRSLKIRISNHQHVYGGNDLHIDPSPLGSSIEDGINSIRKVFPELKKRLPANTSKAFYKLRSEEMRKAEMAMLRASMASKGAIQPANIYPLVRAIGEAANKSEIEFAVSRVMAALEDAPTPNSAATRLPGAPEAGMQERPMAEPTQSKGGAGSDANVTLGIEDGNRIRYNIADDGWSVAEQARAAVLRMAGRPMLDAADPFAAENARLREQNESLWSKAKTLLRRYLAPGGLLPKVVFDEKIKRDSEFQAVEFDVRHLIGGLEHAVKTDFGMAFDKLSKEQMRPITEALAGNVPDSLPEQTKVAALAMRQYIDSMSTEYLKIIQEKIDAKMLKAMESGKDADVAQAINEIELFEKIKGNIGHYVHRSYQAFDDPKWFEKVPADALNAARDYLRKGYLDQGETAEEATRLAEVSLYEILKNGTAYDSMESFISEGKLGAKDLSVLMRRKEVPKEIRDLLGEYPDARLNFTKSATKMGRLIWNSRFLDRVRDIGLGSFFFEGKDRPPAATTQIAAEGSEVYAPLNGLWTFPEVAQAFKDALGKEQMSDLYRAIVRANGIVKYGKTVLSPTTAMRNWQSAMFFSLANGHFDLTQMKKSISAFREQVAQTATGNDLKYLRHLKQLGVVYDTPYAGEMARLMEDARMEELLSSEKGDAVRWFRKANQLAQGFYTFGDDFWKIIGFENEKAGLMKAGLSLQDAEIEAAKRIRDTYPTYSMVGSGIQWLSRFPLAGTFVSFPAEIIRTSANMVRTVAADLKSDNPKLRELGMRRAAGMVFVSAAFYSLAALSKALAGVDDDEEEAIRDLAPQWSKNSTFLYLGRDEKGQIRYFDLTFLDPYGYFKRPLTAAMRDQPWEESLSSSMSDLLTPFFGVDISAGAIFEAVSNKKESGGRVYNENDGVIDQTIDIADHMRKALQPGIAGNVERLVKASMDVKKSSGQAYDLEDEMVALLGWRASTINPKTALHYRSFAFTDALAEARREITSVMRSPNSVSEDDVRDAYAAAQRKQDEAFRKMSRIVLSAEAAGMSRMEIMRALRMSNIAQRNITALLRGQSVPVSVSSQAASKAIRQAGVMNGPEFAQEVRDRFRHIPKSSLVGERQD